jgi:hypothetical protein
MTSDDEVNVLDRETLEEAEAAAREARVPDSERVVDDPEAPGSSVDDTDALEAVEPNEPA